MAMEFLNAFTLIEGRIPAKGECPFNTFCVNKTDNCPIRGKMKEEDFSCAVARCIALVLWNKIKDIMK